MLIESRPRLRDAAMSVCDRTLDALIDHLRDQDLPTILARLADRSEPYYTLRSLTDHVYHTESGYQILIIVLGLFAFCTKLSKYRIYRTGGMTVCITLLHSMPVYTFPQASCPELITVLYHIK